MDKKVATCVTLVKYTREELERVSDETDWKKVDTMTDEEVYQDACNGCIYTTEASSQFPN